MEKKNIIIFIVILLVALAFRVWNLGNFDEFYYEKFVFSLPEDMFQILFSNAIAPLHNWYLWLLSLPYLKILLPYSSIICNILAIIALFFASLEFGDKKNKEETALSATGFCAISVFLIYFAQKNSFVSLAFLLSALVLLFSMKILNGCKNAKNCILLAVFSTLLVLTFNLSIFFVIFNSIALFIFSSKKKKTVCNILMSFLGITVLLLPFVPFILNVIKTPDFISRYSMPFNFEQVAIYFTNIFSPKLNMEGVFKAENFGIWLFVLVPTSICAFLIIKNFLHPKQDNYYMLSVILSTFLSTIIVCTLGATDFSSKYLITIYPMMILALSGGIYTIKAKSTQIVLITLFATMTVFYIIVNNLYGVNLF